MRRGEPRREVSVRVQRLAHAEELALPERASPGSAGLDLRAALEQTLVLDPGVRRLIPTGLVLEIPVGWEGQVRPRSGRAWREGLGVLNSPGTIDSDYRGEVKVLLVNLGSEPIPIHRGERIAQLVLASVPVVEWVEVGAEHANETMADGETSAPALSATERGRSGFGSSGRR